MGLCRLCLGQSALNHMDVPICWYFVDILLICDHELNFGRWAVLLFLWVTEVVARSLPTRWRQILSANPVPRASCQRRGPTARAVAVAVATRWRETLKGRPEFGSTRQNSHRFGWSSLTLFIWFHEILAKWQLGASQTRKCSEFDCSFSGHTINVDLLDSDTDPRSRLLQVAHHVLFFLELAPPWQVSHFKILQGHTVIHHWDH